MTKNKRLVINMTAQIISFVINLGIGFFLTPYIIKNVGADAYGFVGLANNFIGYASIVTVALNSMAGRFITISIHKNEQENTNKYFTSVFVSNVIISAVMAIILFFIVVYINKLIEVPERLIFDVKILWSLLFFNFLLGLVGNVFSVATFAMNRLDLSSLRSIESNILKCIILVSLFTFFKANVWYLGISTFLCGVYVVIFNIYYTKKLLPMIHIKKKYIDADKVKELIKSGIWNSINKISGILNTGLDLLISNIYIGANAMGIVSISKTVPTYVLSAFGMLSSVFMPQLTISYANDKTEEIKEQLLSAIRLLAFFACIPIAGVWVFSKSFYQLWVPEQDSNLLYLLTLGSTMAFPLSLSLEPIWNIFTVTNKVKQSSIALIVSAVVSILGTFILINFVDILEVKMLIVVGFSTFVGIIRTALFLPIYGAKCVNLKWNTFYPVMLKVIVSTIITVALAFAIEKFAPANSWIIFIIDILCVSVVACVVNYFIMLGKKERAILKERVAQKLKKGDK